MILRDIAQIDRDIVLHPHDQVAQIIGVAEKTIEVDREGFIVLGDHSRMRLAVFHLQHVLQARALTPYAASRAGSGSTSIVRRCPPIS